MNALSLDESFLLEGIPSETILAILPDVIAYMEAAAVEIRGRAYGLAMAVADVTQSQALRILNANGEFDALQMEEGISAAYASVIDAKDLPDLLRAMRTLRELQTNAALSLRAHGSSLPGRLTAEGVRENAARVDELLRDHENPQVR